MPRCYNCQSTFPRELLRQTRVLKGYKGRTKNGYVLMCPECSSDAQENNAWVAAIAIGLMLIIGVIVYAVRGY